MADAPAANREERRSNHRELVRLWEQHRAAAWPVGLGAHEGELMTLDTVVGGCVVYVLEERCLDPQRVSMLEDSVSELEALLPDVGDEALDYFERLKRLGALARDVGGRE